MRLQIKQTTYSILARVMFITFAYVYRLNLGYFSGTLEKSAPGEIIPKLVGPCYVYHSGEIVPWRPFLWLQMPWNIARVLRPFNNGRVCIFSRIIDMILLHLIPLSRNVPLVLTRGITGGFDWLSTIDRPGCPIGHFRKAIVVLRVFGPYYYLTLG